MIGTLLKIHERILNAKITNSIVMRIPSVVDSVSIGTKGSSIPTYPPRYAKALATSDGNPFESGNISTKNPST